MDLGLRFDVAAWAVFALVLFGLEVLAPGAFMLLGLMIWAMRTYTGYEEV